MTVQIFVTILVGCSTATALIVECIKTLLGDRPYSSNLLAFITALIVGVGCTAIYYAYTGIPFTGLNVLSMVLMGVCSAVGSTVGYDKVVQLITQLGKSKTDA